MKRIVLLILILAIGTGLSLTAQVPQGVNYQAISRDSTGAVRSNVALMVRFTITDVSAAIVYKETHSVSTNQFGLFTAVIGSGSVVSGNFSTINWFSGLHYLTVETDPDGNGYDMMGTSQFQSVPYALSAGKAANTGSLWTASGSNIYYNTGTVGIGTSTPTSSALLHVDNGKVLIGASGGALPARLVVNTTSNEEIFRGRLNGTTVMTIEDNGDLGIGTASPVGRIDIRHGSSSLFLVDSNGLVGIGNSAPTGRFQVDVAGNPALFVNSSTGWTGIGTSSPGINLDVAFNTSATTNGIRINQNGTGDAVLRFALAGSSKYAIGVDQSDNEYLKIGRGTGVSASTIMTLKVDDVDFADDISADVVNCNRVAMPDGSRVDIGDAYLIWGGTHTLFADCTIRPMQNNVNNLGSAGFRYSTLYLVNSPNVSSDRRLKKDIKDLDYGLDEVLKLRPVTYKWKEGADQRDRIGLIAQELQEVIGEVVTSQEYTVINQETGEKGWKDTETLGVTYDQLIPVLIRAIQEQSEAIKGLQERITRLEQVNK